MEPVSNPFEEYDIDPMMGPSAITERMRELVEDADEMERDGLRAQWEDLTMHPRRRLQLALEAFPETRPPMGSAPPTKRGEIFEAPTLTLRDLVVVPRVVDALSDGDRSRPTLLPPLSDDPLIDPKDATE